MVPDTNLFDLTEAIDLSRCPARKPDWIDVFLLWLTCVHSCGIVGRCGIRHSVGGHDRRTRERGRDR